MGIADFFGFGNKTEKKPFRLPKEVTALRTRIEAELRENFPHLVRYEHIAREAENVYVILNDLIMHKEYAEEATRTKDDLKIRLRELETKIKSNLREGKKEVDQDYVGKNIDYLERKSHRDQAKTLYTEFLTLNERILTYCGEGRQGSGGLLESATKELMETLSDLNSRFFLIYPQDREIQSIKEQSLMRISGLIRALAENHTRLEEQGMAAPARTCTLKLEEARRTLSAQ